MLREHGRADGMDWAASRNALLARRRTLDRCLTKCSPARRVFRGVGLSRTGVASASNQRTERNAGYPISGSRLVESGRLTRLVGLYMYITTSNLFGSDSQKNNHYRLTVYIIFLWVELPVVLLNSERVKGTVY